MLQSFHRAQKKICAMLSNRDNWGVGFAGILALATLLLALIAGRTDSALHESARAANDANKLNVVGLRPWVSSPKPILVSDLTQDKDGVLHL